MAEKKYGFQGVMDFKVLHAITEETLGVPSFGVNLKADRLLFRAHFRAVAEPTKKGNIEL